MHNSPSAGLPLFGISGNASPVQEKRIGFAVVLPLAAVALAGVTLAHSQGTSHAPAPSAAAAAPAVKTAEAAKAADYPAFSYYQKSIRGTLFSPPIPPAPTVKPVIVMPHVLPMPIDPLAGWSYTGNVQFGGRMEALLENPSVHPGQWVKQGGFFLGGRIVRISPQQVEILLDGRPRMLALSDAINPIPLNAPPSAAAAKPGAPAQPAPGAPAPAMPGKAMVFPGGMSMGGFNPAGIPGFNPAMAKRFMQRFRKMRGGK